MNALAIVRSDGKVRGASARGSACLGFGSHAPIDHHQSNPARPTSSHGRRNLTGAHRSGPFIRVGWGCALNELAAVRRLVASGIEERVAAHLAANHPQASGAVQGYSDLPEFHSSASSVRSTNASKIAQKRGQERGFLSQGRAPFTQDGGGGRG